MSLPRPFPMKNFFFTRERPARTPPSTFLFLPIHFSNSPGTMAIPTLRVAGEPAKLVHPRTIGCRFTVPVRSFRGAQSRRKRTARRWVYICFALARCQPEMPIFLGPRGGTLVPADKIRRPTNKQCLNACDAVLRPYSCVVLRVLSRDGIATRGPSATVNQARKFGFVSVVDGP
jgi:hypothetical protein